MAAVTAVTIRPLGLQPYEAIYRLMQQITEQRIYHPTAAAVDEIWLLQHPPIYTLGKNGDESHRLERDTIPLMRVDRGGQITYHAPGQLIAYLLLDIHRLGLGVRELVERLEQAVVALLADYQIPAVSRREAPGVYVAGAKVAALGLRIRRGWSYHGLSLNVDLDLTPFQRINPCGYADLAVTSLAQLGITASMDTLTAQLIDHLTTQLGYTTRYTRPEGELPDVDSCSR